MEQSFSTRRLFLRSWDVSDAEAFYWLSQDEVFSLYPINVYRQASIESARTWILNSRGKFAVIERATNELLGMGGLTPWKLGEEDLVDITYRLRSSAIGRGLGSELARGLVDHGFNTLGLRQISATITPDNHVSKKVAENLGFSFDTRITLNGVPTDLYRLYRNSLTY